MLGLLAGLAVLIGARGNILVAGGLIGAAAFVLVVGYYRQSVDEPDATTAIAALVTLALGFGAGEKDGEMKRILILNPNWIRARSRAVSAAVIELSS